MNIDTVIKNRRSIRKFRDEMVRDDVLDEIIESLHYVPSPLNLRPLDIAVIKSNEKKIKLKSVIEIACETLQDRALKSGNRKLLRIIKSYWRFSETMFSAPVIVALGASDYTSFSNMIEPLGTGENNSKELYIGSVLYHISLKAYALGLGSCIYTSPISYLENMDEVNSLLGIKLMAFICIGYPDEFPKLKGHNEIVQRIRTL